MGFWESFFAGLAEGHMKKQDERLRSIQEALERLAEDSKQRVLRQFGAESGAVEPSQPLSSQPAGPSSAKPPSVPKQASLKAKLKGVYESWEEARRRGDVEAMERYHREARRLDQRIED